jgi:HD-GYP domain-containing protein (c-di-GMP phosphodiesterase class II)
VVAFLLFTSINTFSVAGAIAVSENKSVASIWRQNNIGTLTYDALSLPVAYCFALIYNSFSIPGVIFLGVILLGARELYSKNRQLEKTNQDLLELMVASIEARDPYTSGHSRRVSHFSRIIGRAIGMRGRELERLTIAALLHDVGKIHEMFAPILQKPGKLTAEERAVIELHPIKSAELVAMVSELQDVVVPIRHHHENWNGTGYPDGLAGKAIPLFARVITFADTIDAMTTSRPYRAALGEAEVRAELKRCRGSQFDPEICDVLLASPHFSVLFDLPVPTTCDRLPAPTAVAA